MTRAASAATTTSKAIPPSKRKGSSSRSHHRDVAMATASSSSTSTTTHKVTTSGTTKHHAGVPLVDFARRKGQIRALEEYKKRKQVKQRETVIQLRKYRKVMKQEGFQAGSGKSRKRSLQEHDEEDHTKDGEVVEDQENYTGEDVQQSIHPMNDRVAAMEAEGTEKTRPNKKRHKTNPLQKSIDKAQQKKELAEKAKQEKIEREQEREKRLKERKRMTKLLQRRTKRGQPIIKHMVGNLLAKLEKKSGS